MSNSGVGESSIGIYSDGRYLAHNPDWHQEDSSYKAGLVQRILDRNSLRPSAIADIGCGAGRVAELLARSLGRAQVVGFDISPDASKFWEGRQSDNLRFVLGDYSASGERFDVALCLDVFEHVPDYLGFLSAIRKKSDYVIFNIPLDMCVIKLITSGIRRAREEVGHLHYFNEYTALSTIRQAGYMIEDAFLATPVFSTLPRNILQGMMAFPRIAVGLISAGAAATLLGGYSLVVLAKC